MKNPLTDWEKASVGRMLNHDLCGVLNNMFFLYEHTKQGTFNDQAMKDNHNHLQAFWRSLSDLSTQDEVKLQHVGYDEVRDMMSQLEHMVGRKGAVGFSIATDIKLMSSQHLLYSALYNLGKNSLTHSGVDSVVIRAENHGGRVPNLVYRCRSTPVKGEFVMFGTHDRGKGFPTDCPHHHWLELDTSTKDDSPGHCRAEKGFGLHYARLVCRYLGCHMSIHSEPGDTRVEIYHPVHRPYGHFPASL